MIGVLMKRRNHNSKTGAHRENATWWWRWRWEWYNSWARNPKDCHNYQQLEESRKDFTQSCTGRAALPTPWIQNSRLPIQERISFSCGKPLSFIYLFFHKINRGLVWHAWQTLLTPLTDESTGLREVEHLPNITQRTPGLCTTVLTFVLFPDYQKLPYL